MFTIFDAIVIGVILFVSVTKLKDYRVLALKYDRASKWGYSIAEVMNYDAKFREVAARYALTRLVLRILCVGYAGSWVLYWLS